MCNSQYPRNARSARACTAEFTSVHDWSEVTLAAIDAHWHFRNPPFSQHLLRRPLCLIIIATVHSEAAK